MRLTPYNRTTGRSPEAFSPEETKKEEIKRVISALFGQYDNTVRGEVEEIRRLTDSRQLASVNQSEQNSLTHFCPQAKQAAEVLISAHSTYITPAGMKWLSLKSRTLNDYGSKTAKIDWYTKSTEITNSELSESNFHTVMQEVYTDRVLGGTGACFVGGSETEDLHFIHVPLGLFAIGEDNKGNVNTFVRKFRLTAQQALDEWGLSALPERVYQALQDSSKRYTEKFTFLHLVRPRTGAQYKAQDVTQLKRPFEGIYVDEDSYTILKEEGYYEFPYFVTRFIRGNESPYGISPALSVLPTIRQLQKLERLLDVQAEVAAFPRILQLASQNRQIDLRAGGITTVSQEEAQLGFPRELGTNARHDIGLERIAGKVDIINSAFFVKMLNAISAIDRPMTATEINAREAEKVLGFSPSFTLFTSDFKHCIRRVLAILYRQDKLPKQGMPEELMERDEDGNITILNPNIVYSGKIAQAIERVQRMGILDVLHQVGSYISLTGDASMAKALKPMHIARYLVEASGAPSDILCNDQELAEIQAQEAAAQEAAAAQQQQMADVSALQALSKAKQ